MKLTNFWVFWEALPSRLTPAKQDGLQATVQSFESLNHPNLVKSLQCIGDKTAPFFDCCSQCEITLKRQNINQGRKNEYHGCLLVGNLLCEENISF